MWVPMYQEGNRMAVIDDAIRDGRAERDLTIESYEAPTSHFIYDNHEPTPLFSFLSSSHFL